MIGWLTRHSARRCITTGEPELICRLSGVESHVTLEWDLEGDVVNERDVGVDQRCEPARRQVHRVDR